MKTSEPNFFQLFRRSRYGGTEHADIDTQEALRATEQRERFAVAVVGFCLKHDDKFAAHFWQRVCRLPDDPDGVGSIQVEVEPEHWADLRLTVGLPNNRIVCIIECKAGAPLEDKQNPTCTEFMRSGFGYGYFINASALERRVEHRYIVLGATERIDSACRRADRKMQFEVLQRSWRCLIDNAPINSLTTDLFESLSQLGITSFRMNRASQVQGLTGFGDAAKAWDVLSVLGGADVCGFRPSYWRIVGENPATDYFNLGAYLKRPPEKKETSKLHDSLFEKLRPEGDFVVWVGYETGPTIKPNQFRRSIYFYCASPQAANKMVERFRREFPNCDAFQDGGCAVLASSGVSGLKDLEWFETMLKFVAK